MPENNKKLLDKFLSISTFKDPSQLKLDNYTGIGENRNDFTYWIEWTLDCFGGIKGGSSYKFGVYKCNDKPQERNGYSFADDGDGNIYAWAEKYTDEKNNTKEKAFETVKERINSVIKAVQGESIDYDTIEKIELGDAYKWKIAFLYSNYRLVPVYKLPALSNAAKRIGVYPEGEGKITIAKLQKKLMEHYESNKEKYDYDICKFGSYVWQIGTSDFSQNNQIIKYGAPGTGKTYSVKIETREFFDIWKMDAKNGFEKLEDHYEFVQFHPSYTYEDFIEGIKPVINNAGQTELKLKNGVFKAFCKKAAKYELWLLNNNFLQDKDLNDITIKDIKGKEECPIQYPTETKDDEPISKYIPPYFFVIDEINRADLSRVFGELMYCLEYRGYKGRIKTQYSELESGETLFYEENGQHYFFIPNNVYIIGTMNTIDRSIESFDFALRRRFLWQRVDPSETVLQKYFEDNDKNDFADYILPLWKALNNKINDDGLLGPDYQIGHSYLMKLDKYPDCTKTSYRDIIWAKHIQPVLEEYFRGTGDAKDRIDNIKEAFIPQNKSKNRSNKNGSDA